MDDQGGTSSANVTALPHSSLSTTPPATGEPDAASVGPTVQNTSTSSNEDPSASDRPVVRVPDEVKSGFWLTHADQFVLAALLTIVLALLAAYWVRLTKWGTVPVEIEHLEPRQLDFKIDMNTATWVEWGQLDGIGDALARRIVTDREQNGPFQSIDELRRVKGIGPKTLEKLRPWLMIGPDSPETDDRSGRRRASGDP
jgi:competence protein ComEA